MNKTEINTFYQIIGDRISQKRIEADITQEELATILEVTRTSITNLEAGKQHMPIHRILIIANVLGITLQDLLPQFDCNSYFSRKDKLKQRKKELLEIDKQIENLYKKKKELKKSYNM